MGQTTRSQGISFTHEMWERIEQRCKQLNFGRSQYFHMLVDWDLRYLNDIHAHKSDGKWHLYPEPRELEESEGNLRAAEESAPAAQASRGRRRKTTK